MIQENQSIVNMVLWNHPQEHNRRAKFLGLCILGVQSSY